MRIVVASDAHLDRVTLGVRRFDEVAGVLRAAAEHAIRSKADAFVFAGDLADPDGGSVVLRCAAEAVKVASSLANAEISSYWMTGNHDVAEDGLGTSTLEPVRHVHGFADVVDSPQLEKFWNGRSGGYVLMLPFPSRVRDYDPAEAVRGLLLSGLAQDGAVFGGTSPLVVVSHLSVPGMHPGSEVGEMARNRDVGLPISALKEVAAKRPVLVVQGHYHRGGRYVVDGLPIHVVGAPARLARDEADARDTGFIIVGV